MFISILLIGIQNTNGIDEIKFNKYYISSKDNDSVRKIKVQSIQLINIVNIINIEELINKITNTKKIKNNF